MALSKTVNVIKLGGRVMDDELELNALLKAISLQQHPCIIIHGGGEQVSKLSKDLGLKPQFIDGRRVTDKASLELVIMVLSGLINKTLVARLQANGVNAFGLSGVDANVLLSEKRGIDKHDFGFVGDMKWVNVSVLINMLDSGLLPVLAPITHDGSGQLLNTNADTVAYEVAKSMANAHDYQVSLYYCMDLPGVYESVENPQSLIEELDLRGYQDLRTQGKIHQGMLVKLENCFNAMESGVNKVVISNAQNIAKALVNEPYQATRLRQISRPNKSHGHSREGGNPAFK